MIPVCMLHASFTLKVVLKEGIIQLFTDDRHIIRKLPLHLLLTVVKLPGGFIFRVPLTNSFLVDLERSGRKTQIFSRCLMSIDTFQFSRGRCTNASCSAHWLRKKWGNSENWDPLSFYLFAIYAAGLSCDSNVQLSGLQYLWPLILVLQRKWMLNVCFTHFS